MKTSTPIEPKTVPNRIGYARVSSIGQNLDSQMDALKQAGCLKIFTDKLTGSRMERPGWAELLEYIRPGDILVVTELSRMTRSLLHLLETAKILEQRQINLLSLRESIDTTTATARNSRSIWWIAPIIDRKQRPVAVVVSILSRNDNKLI